MKLVGKRQKLKEKLLEYVVYEIQGQGETMVLKMEYLDDRLSE
jgi:hypothetical protein